MDAMYQYQELSEGWLLQLSRPSLRGVPLLLPELPPSLGGEISTRTKMLSGCAIRYAHIRRRPLARIVGAVKAGLSEIYQALPVPLWPATALLRVHGIWQPLRSPPFSRDYLWQADRAGATARRALAKRLLCESRSADRGYLGKGIDLCKGLQYWNPGEQHNAICSGLRFEKQMEPRRWLLENRMGPPEQEAIHWTTSIEDDERRAFHLFRRPSLRGPRYGAGYFQDGWETLSGTTTHEAGALRFTGYSLSPRAAQRWYSDQHRRNGRKE